MNDASDTSESNFGFSETEAFSSTDLSQFEQRDILKEVYDQYHIVEQEVQRLGESIKLLNTQFLEETLADRRQRRTNGNKNYPRQPAAYAIGVERSRVWWLFSLKEKRWTEFKKFPVSKGCEELFMTQLAENHGFLSEEAAIKNHYDYQKKGAKKTLSTTDKQDIMAGGLKSLISRLRLKFWTECGINREHDPLPFTKNRRGSTSGNSSFP